MNICVKSLLQDNFNTARMSKIRLQTVMVLQLEHGPPDILFSAMVTNFYFQSPKIR